MMELLTIYPFSSPLLEKNSLPNLLKSSSSMTDANLKAQPSKLIGDP